jgi:hypothetical protein
MSLAGKSARRDSDSVMKNLIIIVLLSVAAFDLSCSAQELSKQERGEGWKFLFNGTDLTGWTNRGKTTVSNWVPEDGALVLKTPRAGDLVYVAEQFENFELSIDWKAEGNSGVLVRMSSQEDWLNTGMEIQVLPRGGTNTHSAGALYDLVAPPVAAKVREKDWNNFHIICNGPLVSCEMNGVETFRIDLRDERWKTPQGKFKIPYALLPRKGWIMLQDHGSAVAYRNIKIKPL